MCCYFSMKGSINIPEIPEAEQTPLIVLLLDIIRQQQEQIEEQQRTRNCFLESRMSCKGFLGMIGRSKGIQRVFSEIRGVARTNSAVMITGESGTGKALVANAIHRLSARNKLRFMTLNCAAIPEQLLEVELFGHEKVAFRGARAKKGLFEMVDSGTILLNEIGEMSLKLQPKLLRVLQHGEVKRVGSDVNKKVDFRIISTTSSIVELERAIKNMRFSKELYYRASVVTINIPSLRERADDIPLLSYHFLNKYSGHYDKKIEDIPPATMEKLTSYHWAGNVRELENAIERAVIFSSTNELELWAFPENVQQGKDLFSCAKEKENEFDEGEGWDW